MTRHVVCLLYFKDGYEEWHKAIPEGESFLGRGEDCVFRIDHEKLSRHHVKFERNRDLIHIENVSSFGLLMINGEPREHVELNVNDKVNIEGLEFLVKELPMEEHEIEKPTPTTTEHSIEQSVVSEPSHVPEPSVSQVPAWQPAQEGSLARDSSVSSGQLEASATSAGERFSDDESGDRTKIMSSVSLGKLVVLTGADAGKEFPLSKNELVIGRSPSCDIAIHDDSLSRKHSKIVRSGGMYRVMDLESSNGTRVNGIRVIEQVLKSFDTIQIGDTEIRFVMIHKDFNLESGQALQEASGRSMAMGPNLEEIHTRQFEMNGLIEERSHPAGTQIINGGFPPNRVGGGRGFRGWWASRTKPQRLIYFTVACLLLLIGLSKLKGKNQPEVTKEELVPVTQSPEVKGIPPEFYALPEDQKIEIERSYNNAVTAYQQSKWLDVKKEANFIKSKITNYKEIETLLNEANNELEKLDKQDYKKITEEENNEKSEDLYYYLSEADNFLKAANFFEARKNYEKVLEIDPTNYEAQRGRDAALAQQTDKDWKDKQVKVQADEDERIKQRVTNGRLLIEAEQFDQGVLELEAVIRTEKPHDFAILDNAREWIEYAKKAKVAKFEPDLLEGEDLIRQGRFEDAHRVCHKVAEFLPSNTRAEQCMAVAVTKLEQRARKIYRNALIEEYLGNQRVAKELYERIIQSFPTELSYYRRAEKKLRKYDPEN